MVESVTANVLPFERQLPAFERRRYPRQAPSGIQARPGGRRLEILDLSQRGMAILSDHPFSVGGLYLFELVDGGRSLMVEGRVCWTERRPADETPFESEPAARFQSGVAFVGMRSRVSETTSATADVSSPAGPRRAPEDEQLIADRVRKLQRSDSADESAEILLELLSPDFEHLVLFRLHGEEIRAWLGRGPTLVPDRLLRLRLPLSRASVFLHLQEGGSFFYGDLPAMFADLRLLQCWEGRLERECVLFPVRLGHRLVAVLYADCGELPLTPEHLGSLKRATDLFTDSLVDQILRRKRRRPENGG